MAFADVGVFGFVDQGPEVFEEAEVVGIGIAIEGDGEVEGLLLDDFEGGAEDLRRELQKARRHKVGKEKFGFAVRWEITRYDAGEMSVLISDLLGLTRRNSHTKEPVPIRMAHGF